MYITVDNRNTKSPAGTPLFLMDRNITGVTVQGTAVIFTSSLLLSNDVAIGHLNRGFNMKNGRMFTLSDEFSLEIASPVISILQVAVRGAREE